jgi:hypothetical protein
VLVQHADFNDAAAVVRRSYQQEWSEIDQILQAMPLHVKGSDQAGIQGRAIFDPVGTNDHIKSELQPHGWTPRVPIPSGYRFFGTDIDLWKPGVVGEVQFSNYPFLMNNVMRTEVLFRSGTVLRDERPPELLIVITKARMFPASQSTLYYEQAVNQVGAVVQAGALTVATRVVGLFEAVPSTVNAYWTAYHAARYSRTVVARTLRVCDIGAGRTASARAVVTVR